MAGSLIPVAAEAFLWHTEQMSIKRENWLGLSTPVAVLLLIFLFGFRVFYGLGLEWRQPDEIQIYLLGLKFFTTQTWPYFGPDVIHTDNQIAGALQSLLVGVPLFVWRHPVAPLLFLNLLSFASLLWFAQRLHRLWPLAPGWMVAVWLLTTSWTLNISTHTYNPSYLLVFAIIFFIGFFEVIPSLTLKDMPKPLPFFLMGFALVCVQQLHLSWPLFLPFMGVALIFAWRARWPLGGIAGGLLVGVAMPALLILPTALEYGPTAIIEALHNNSRNVNTVNIAAFPSIVARVTSLAAYELGGFLGGNAAERWQTLRAVPWTIPFAAVLGVLGILQPLLLLGGLYGPVAWRRQLERMPRRAIGFLLAGTLLLAVAAFAFTTRPPLTRNLYLLAPVVWIAGYAVFGSLVNSPRRRAVVGGLFASSVILHIGVALYHFDAFPFRTVPWSETFHVVEKAIDMRDYHVLGERRAASRY